MLHTNRGELQLLMNTFCRIWEASGQATLTTSTEGGELKAKLEIQLGSPAAPRTGAPSTTSGHPAVSHRPCHRGPAAKARSRARAAAYQAKKAAAVAASAKVSSTAGSGEASPSSVSQRRPLHLLPSPPAGRRRVMSVGRRDMPSFAPLNLDGTHPSLPPPTSTAGPALSSPVPRDDQLPTPGDALLPPASVTLAAAAPAQPLEDASASPGDSVLESDSTPVPTPGDAARFLAARPLWQCGALAKGGKSCEKIFCCADDLSEHLWEDHKSRNWNAYCVELYIDEHDYLYIL